MQCKNLNFIMMVCTCWSLFKSYFHSKLFYTSCHHPPFTPISTPMTGATIHKHTCLTTNIHTTFKHANQSNNNVGLIVPSRTHRHGHLRSRDPTTVHSLKDDPALDTQISFSFPTACPHLQQNNNTLGHYVYPDICDRYKAIRSYIPSD